MTLRELKELEGAMGAVPVNKGESGSLKVLGLLVKVFDIINADLILCIATCRDSNAIVETMNQPRLFVTLGGYSLGTVRIYLRPA